MIALDVVPMTVTAFLHEVGLIFESVIGWLTSVGQAIASDGILLTFVAVSLIFLGVNLYRRMLNV